MLVFLKRLSWVDLLSITKSMSSPALPSSAPDTKLSLDAAGCGFSIRPSYYFTNQKKKWEKEQLIEQTTSALLVGVFPARPIFLLFSVLVESFMFALDLPLVRVMSDPIEWRPPHVDKSLYLLLPDFKHNSEQVLVLT